MKKKRKDFFNANSVWEAEDSKVDLFLPNLLKPHTPEAALAPGEEEMREEEASIEMEASIENMLGLAPLPLPPPSPRIVVSPNHIVLPKAMAAMPRKKRVDALPIPGRLLAAIRQGRKRQLPGSPSPSKPGSNFFLGSPRAPREEEWRPTTGWRPEPVGLYMAPDLALEVSTTGPAVEPPREARLAGTRGAIHGSMLHTLPRLRAAEQVEKVRREGREGREGREDLVVKPGADFGGHQVAAGGGPRSDAPAFSQTMGTKVPKALKLDTKRHRKTVDQRRQAEASRQEMKFRMIGVATGSGLRG